MDFASFQCRCLFLKDSRKETKEKDFFFLIFFLFFLQVFSKDDFFLKDSQTLHIVFFVDFASFQCRCLFLKDSRKERKRKGFCFLVGAKSVLISFLFDWIDLHSECR